MPVLKVENISKLYRLGEVGTGTISHDLNRWWARVRGKEDPYAIVGQTNDRSQKAESDYVWALKDINFEVKQGEILGIIGRNGAGKSTLLKILSQITSQTTGTIKTKGRIASLLEVGTGMNPEMTARENIYLNGAILGMTRKEITAKFDEIVDFSGCTMYVDTPLKRFSSGMRVRLGFAVAAFLEPEILIVDEVLAVGDAEFQKKAIGKMKDISAGGGRTVLFVSHNMAAINSLCTSTMIIENGEVKFQGKTSEAVERYMSLNNDSSSKRLYNYLDKGDNVDFRIVNTKIFAEKKIFEEPITRSDSILFETIIQNKSEKKFHFMYRIKDDNGNFLFVANSDTALPEKQNTLHKIRMTIPAYFFNEGSFFVDTQVSDGKKILFRQEDVLVFNIIQEKKQLGDWMGKTVGPLKPQFKWEIEKQ